MPQLLSGDPEVLATEAGQRWYGAADHRRPRHDLRHGDGDRRLALRRRAADQERERRSATPGRPTPRSPTATTTPAPSSTIIGFEWTAIGGYNLHRNVLFRGDAGVAEPDAAVLAVRQQEPRGPLDLHGGLRGRGPASDVLAIPHNGNLSNGRMFTVESFDGQPLTAELAAQAHPLRAADRGHPDQGRRRVAPVPVPDRRVRRLRDLGPLEPERHRGEDARHAEVRVRPRGAEDRAQARERARRQPLQVRHDRLDRLAHLARRPPRRTTSSASTPASSPSRTAGSTW